MAQELSQERRSELAHANQLQVEIMKKGRDSGEPVERLLLKALECIALKDNDTVSYPEAKKDTARRLRRCARRNYPFGNRTGRI